jgi:hypothetical protein
MELLKHVAPALSKKASQSLINKKLDQTAWISNVKLVPANFMPSATKTLRYDENFSRTRLAGESVIQMQMQIKLSDVNTESRWLNTTSYLSFKVESVLSVRKVKQLGETRSVRVESV